MVKKEWCDGVEWNKCACGCNQVMRGREFRKELEELVTTTVAYIHMQWKNEFIRYGRERERKPQVKIKIREDQGK